MRLQEPWTYVVCLSRSVAGCVAVLVNLGDGEVDWIRVQIPLKDLGSGPSARRIIKYQLGDEVDNIGGWIPCPSSPINVTKRHGMRGVG
jgi:hypothetical protein